MPPEPQKRSNPGLTGTGYDTSYHKPVLCSTVVDALISDRSGIYVDGTLGGGGHTAALLDHLEPAGRVIGIDRDSEAIEETHQRLLGAVESHRLTLVQAGFATIDRVLSSEGIDTIDGFLLDLGVSSHQLDAGERGFSFRFDGPLDMRMDADSSESAYELINETDVTELRRVLYTYGEVRAARRIADAIAKARPIRTTEGLAEAVRSLIPSRDAAKILAQVFQAVRIAVNGEMTQLERALEAATPRIRIGGRIAVISYHSLEDRRVKRFLRYGNFEGRAQRDLHGNLITPWNPVWKKAIAPDPEEIDRNPRARSARLRVAERIPLPTPPTS